MRSNLTATEKKLVDRVIKPEEYDDRFKHLIKKKYAFQDETLEKAMKMYDEELNKALKEHNKRVKENATTKPVA